MHTVLVDEVTPGTSAEFILFGNLLLSKFLHEYESISWLLYSA